MNRRLRTLHPLRASRGFSYVELLVVVIISGMISLALMGLMDTATDSSDTVITRNELNRELRFAMNRMVDMTSRSPRLLLPLTDNPNTNWPENLREQTVPPSAPIGDSTFASAVLAINLPRDIDLDQDGTPDADDDGDGLFDEDFPNDNQFDYTAGIIGIDDDGDGSIDEGDTYDDDEDGSINEDPIDGIDNDGDGSIDEDTPSDMNADGCPGFCGVDDDFSGNISTGNADNDDENPGEFEDSLDPVVYYLNGNRLIERLPAPWDTDGKNNPSGPVDGRDFVEAPIANNVTRFRVERIDTARGELIDLTLELTDPVSGESVSLQTSVRAGANL